MNDLAQPAIRESIAEQASNPDKRSSLPRLLRKDVAVTGPVWLPLALVLVAIAATAYADHSVVSISLIYLYILPLTIGAIFLRSEISY